MAAESFDIAGDFAHAAPLGPLEEHVFMEMRESLFARPLIGRADTGPDLKLDHGRAMTLPQQDRQSIGEDAMRRRIVVGRSGLVQSAARVPEAVGTRPPSLLGSGSE